MTIKKLPNNSDRYLYGYHTSIPGGKRPHKMKTARRKIGTRKYGPVLNDDEWIDHVGRRYM